MMSAESRNTLKDVNMGGYQGLDIIKLLMAFLILMRHVFQSYVSIDSALYFVVADSLSPIGVPTFFVISGFLFFDKGGDLKKQCFRLLKLYIIYSIIYLPFSVRNLTNEGYHSWKLVLRYIQEFIFKGSYYHLWYVPALIVGLMLCVFFARKNQVKADIIVALLFIIGLIGRNYYSLIPGCENVVSAYNKVFLTFCNGLFWGCPMVWMGRKLCSIINQPTKQYYVKMLVIILTVVSFVLLFFESYLVRNITPDQINSNLICADYIAVVFVAAGIKMHVHICNDSRMIRIFGTLLYFIHPLMLWIIPFISKKLVSMSTTIEMIVVCIFAIFISLLVTIASKRIKLLKILF